MTETTGLVVCASVGKIATKSCCVDTQNLRQYETAPKNIQTIQTKSNSEETDWVY